MPNTETFDRANNATTKFIENYTSKMEHPVSDINLIVSRMENVQDEKSKFFYLAKLQSRLVEMNSILNDLMTDLKKD